MVMVGEEDEAYLGRVGRRSVQGVSPGYCIYISLKKLSYA